MRLHRLRLGAKAGERGVGARRAGVSFGWERRPESPDCAERIGWERLRRSALVRGRVAPFRFSGERGDDRAALLKPGLPGREFAELARERFEVERALAGDLIESSARFGQAALVGAFHCRLPRDHGREEVVVEGDIGADRGGPDDQENSQRRERP